MTPDFIEGRGDEKILYHQIERGTGAIEDAIEAAPKTGERRGIRKGDAGHVLAPQESVEVESLVIVSNPQNDLGQSLLPRIEEDLTVHIVIRAPQKRGRSNGVQEQQGGKKRKNHLILIP